MVKQYKIQRSKRGNLIRMPAKVSEYYERHVEKNGVIWFRPSSKPKVKPPAEAIAAPAPVPTPVRAPTPTPASVPTQPVVIVARKPVAAPPTPRLPVFDRDLSSVEKQKLLVVTNRMFGRGGDIIRANALPPEAGLVESGLTKGMLFRYLEERVAGGFVTATGIEYERVYKLRR
jgi:hypothetical protein